MKSLPKSLFIFENVSTTLCNASKVFSTHVRQTPVREQSQVLEDPSPSLLAFRPGLGRHPSPPLCWPTQGQVFNSPPRPKILGLGSWVLGLGSWVSGLGSWVLGLGSWVLGLGSWVFGPRPTPGRSVSLFVTGVMLLQQTEGKADHKLVRRRVEPNEKLVWLEAKDSFRTGLALLSN